jgi:hypothetical protein
VREAPESLDDVVVKLGKFQISGVAQRAEEQDRTVLVFGTLAVLEGHVEEGALIKCEFLIEAAVDSLLCNQQREMVGRELIRMPRNMFRGSWSNRITAARAVSASDKKALTGSWRFSVQSIRKR